MLTKVSLLLLSLSSSAFALSQCVVSDSNWNLLAFGFDGKDYSVGTQDGWGSGSPQEITADGRPPFDSDKVSCHLAQFFNAIYVLNADKSNPNNLYIYNAGDKAWSTQSTNANGFDASSATAILDHDTNVFYAMSAGTMYSLNMDELASAQPNAIDWEEVGKPNFSTDGYEPVMGLAQNHVHFIGAPGLEDGNADIFVIHFAYFQPEPQWYGGYFPQTHGQAPSIFKPADQGVQTQFAFIPDDPKNAYVIDVTNNQTSTLPPPTVDAGASYFATPSAIVQLSSAGQLSFIPYDAEKFAAGADSWSAINAFSSVASSVSSSMAGTASGGSEGTSPAGGAASPTPSDDEAGGDGALTLMTDISGRLALLTTLLTSALYLAL